MHVQRDHISLFSLGTANKRLLRSSKVEKKETVKGRFFSSILFQNGLVVAAQQSRYTRIHRRDYHKSLRKLSGQMIPQRVERLWLRDTAVAGISASVKR